MAVAHQFGERSRTNDVIITESVDFAGLLLSQAVLKGLHNAGFERPSPIQLKAIPLGRCGLDLIVQAKSGTGKTCVFSVITLENIEKSASSTQALVLAPTREIAIQIWEVIQSIGSAIPGLQCHTFIGGMPVHEDKRKLQRCHIAVGTPGRIQNLIEQGVLKTDSIRLFVLDEADKLLEESFQSQINWIYSALPDNKQMLALSATYPEYLAQHLTKYMRNPTFIRLNITDPTLLGIKQYYITVPSHPLLLRMFEAKTAAVVKILSSVSFHQCLIFSNMQTRAQNLESELTSRGWPATCIAGSLDQKERISAMSKLKTYQCRVLISTDLTSRGIDADRVNLVINLDVPRDHETYLHRIGRAGRFGSYGAGVTIVSDGEELLLLHVVERQIGTHILPLPDPIPSDLVQQQLKVSLDDVVSTEQLVTHPRTQELIANGTEQSSMLDKKEVNSQAGAEAKLTSELSKPEEKNQQGLESCEYKGDIPVVTAIPEDAVTECLMQVSVEHKRAAALAKDIEPLCDNNTILTTDQMSIVSAVDPSEVKGRLHGPDAADGDGKADEEADDGTTPAAFNKDRSFDNCGSSHRGDSGDGDSLALDAKPFCHDAPDSGQETVCGETVVINGGVPATLNVDVTKACVLPDSEVELPSASVTVLNNTTGVTNHCKEDKLGSIVQKVEISKCGTVFFSKNLQHHNSDGDTFSSSEINERSGGIIENKHSPQRYKKANSAASTWSAMLCERAEEQRSSTPQSQSKSNSAASIWTSMLASDFFKDSSVSPSLSDSFSSSSSDVRSSNSNKLSKGTFRKKQGRKKQANLSFESELQDYIRARAKMEEKKAEDGDAAPCSSPTKDITKRPLTKAKRKFAADGAKSYHTTEHILSSSTAESHHTSEHIICSSTAESSTVSLNSPCDDDQNGFSKSTFSSVSESPEKTSVSVGISSDKTKDGLGCASATEHRNPVVYLQATNPLSNESSTVHAEKMGEICTTEQMVLSISLPPAPKLLLSSRSGTKMIAAFPNYSSALQDYRNFLDTTSLTPPTLLSARQLVQKTCTMTPAFKIEQERQALVCFLQQFQRSLAETGNAGLTYTGLTQQVTTDSTVSVKQGAEIACSEKILTGGGVATSCIGTNKQKHKTIQSGVQNDHLSDQSEEHVFDTEVLPDESAGEIHANGNQGITHLEIAVCEKGDNRSITRDKVTDGKSDKQLLRSGTVQKPPRQLRLQGYMTVCGQATEDLFGFMKNSGTAKAIAEGKDKRTEEQDNQLNGPLPSSQVGPVLEGYDIDVPDSAPKEVQNQNTVSVKEKSLKVFENKERESAIKQKVLTLTVASHSQSETREIMGKGAIPKQNKTATEKPLSSQKPAVRSRVLGKGQQEKCSDDDTSFLSSTSSSSSSEEEHIVEKGEDSSICFQNLYASDITIHAHRKKPSSKALHVGKEREEKAKGVDRIYMSGKASENILSMQNEKSSKRRTKSKKLAKPSERKTERLNENISEPLTAYKSWLQNYLNSYGMNSSTEISSYPWAYAWSQMGSSQPYHMGLPPFYSMLHTKPEANIEISPPLPGQPQPPHFSQQPEYYHQPGYSPQDYVSQQPEYYHRFAPQNCISQQPEYYHQLCSAPQNYTSQQPEYYHQLRSAPQNYISQQPEYYHQLRSAPQNYISQQPNSSCYPLGYSHQPHHPDFFCPQPRSGCFDPNSQSHVPSYPSMETPLYYPGNPAAPNQRTTNDFRRQGFHGDHPVSVNGWGAGPHFRPQPAMSVESAWAVAERMQKYIRRMAKFYARFVDHES